MISSSESDDEHGSAGQDFTIIGSAHTGTRSPRGAIKAELVGKLDFDQDGVFGRLKLDQVPDKFVKACMRAMDADNKLQSAKSSLLELIRAAEGRSEEELESETEVVKGETGVESKVKSKARERKMYPFLVTIFDYIEAFGNQNDVGGSRRQWITTGSSTLTAEGDTLAFPRIAPDFTLVDVPLGSRYEYGTTENPPHLWRDRSGFAEIKPSSTQSIKGARSTTVTPLVTQAGDYARLHMSARPFLLFSIALLIFGSKFCIAIFDRDGVQFSRIHDVWINMDVFIRVIRRLTCEMSPVELGHDPSVELVPLHDSPTKWQNLAQSLLLPSYSTYRVSMGKGNDCWYTLGPPMWTSLSLLGRGTSIWRVCDSTEEQFVLKNNWRSSERVGEATIYASLGPYPGLATYASGGDVVFPGTPDRLMSVQNIRSQSSANNVETVVLHRLLLQTRGRSLWEFETEAELLKGILSALKAHKFLYEERGILHRDISAGNIMLAVDHDDGQPAGFLMDVEYAHSADSKFHPVVKKTTVEVERGVSRVHKKFGEVSVKRGAPLTGTLQFMASPLLEALAHENPVTHRVQHDLESFIWVLCYSLLRGWMFKGPSPRRTRSRTAFKVLFGHITINSIFAVRLGGTKAGMHIIDPDLSTPLKSLFVALNNCLHGSRMDPPDPQRLLTHSSLIGMLETAITTI
ncbi:hypothetical protein K439DRAFT_1629360 [Ramaria rubella]|nr:hypothetical protein K439DRAFT_1629360 [Ramaria rubella]